MAKSITYASFLAIAFAVAWGAPPVSADDGAQTTQKRAAKETAGFTDSYPDTSPADLDLYLVIGQSNMAGRARVRAEDEAALDRVYLFTGDKLNPWADATNPLNRHSTIRKTISMQRLSPAYSFAKQMAAADNEQAIGIVMNARGGTGITQWLPGTKYFDEAVARTRQALRSGSIKGIIWHQGEGDCQPKNVAAYLDRMDAMVSGFRQAFGNDELPFVAGELFATAHRKPFNQMLSQLPERISHTAVVSSAGTTTMDGSPPESGTHFDSASQVLLGTRYAEQMLKLRHQHQ